MCEGADKRSGSGRWFGGFTLCSLTRISLRSFKNYLGKLSVPVLSWSFPAGVGKLAGESPSPCLRLSRLVFSVHARLPTDVGVCLSRVEVHRSLLPCYFSCSMRNPWRDAMKANDDDNNIVNCCWKMGSACLSKALPLSAGGVTSFSCVADM